MAILRKYYLFNLFLAILFITACKKQEEPSNTTAYKILPSGTILEGTFKENILLKSGNEYFLKGQVVIADEFNVKIEPGVVIKGLKNFKSTLIIDRGAKIFAEGTADKPIVFTSAQAIGSRNPGDWGGIVILGKARTNKLAEPVAEGINLKYGGTNDLDDSGILKFLKIEFAGTIYDLATETNALTLCAVGAKTIIENIQVVYANDDAFEFFGGTVNGRYLFAYASNDDDFDFDLGYTGMIQYGAAIKDPNFADSGDPSNGIESDNDGGSTTATPLTKPILSNFTLIGPAETNLANHNFALRFRRSTNFVFCNSIIANHVKGGLCVESDVTYNSLFSDVSAFKNNLVFAKNSLYKIGSNITTEGSSASMLQFKAEQSACVNFDDAQAIQLKNTLFNGFNLMPAGSSPANTGTKFEKELENPFFKKEVFRGAFGTVNWAAWMKFNYTKTANGY